MVNRDIKEEDEEDLKFKVASNKFLVNKRRHQNWAGKSLSYASEHLITYNLRESKRKVEDVSVNSLDYFGPKDDSAARSFVRDCLTIFWDVENFSVVTPNSRVYPTVSNKKKRRATATGQRLSTVEDFFVIPEGDVAGWVALYMNSLKDLAMYLGYGNLALYIYCKKREASRYQPTCDSITAAFQDLGAAVVDCIKDSDYSKIKENDNLDDLCDNRMVASVHEFLLKGKQFGCIDWGCLMFMTGDLGLRNKLWNAIVLNNEFKRMKLPHFFCANGLRYEYKGPHRPWFTQFAHPRSLHSAHYVYLSDPCFFDDFAGVVIPDNYNMSGVKLHQGLPLTPQEEFFYSRLQPLPYRVGQHPNFNFTEEFPPPVIVQPPQQCSSSNAAHRGGPSIADPREEMDVHLDIQNFLEEKKQEAARPSTSRTSKAAKSQKGKRTADADIPQSPSKLAKNDPSSGASGKFNPADQVVDDDVSYAGPLEATQDNRSNNADNVNAAVVAANILPTAENVEALSTSQGNTKTGKAVKPAAKPPTSRVASSGKQIAQGISILHPDVTKVIGYLVNGWYVFPTGAIGNFKPLSNAMALWLTQRRDNPTLAQQLESGPRPQGRAGQDSAAFYRDNGAVISFVSGNTEFVLMNDHYMKQFPLAKGVVVRHVSGKCEARKSKDFNWRKCMCFNDPEIIDPEYDPRQHANALEYPPMTDVIFDDPQLTLPEDAMLPLNHPQHPKKFLAFTNKKWYVIDATLPEVEPEELSLAKKNVISQILKAKKSRTFSDNPDAKFVSMAWYPKFFTLPNETTIRTLIREEPTDHTLARVLMDDNDFRLVPKEIVELHARNNYCNGLQKKNLTNCVCFNNMLPFDREGKNVHFINIS